MATIHPQTRLDNLTTEILYVISRHGVILHQVHNLLFDDGDASINVTIRDCEGAPFRQLLKDIRALLVDRGYGWATIQDNTHAPYSWITIHMSLWD